MRVPRIKISYRNVWSGLNLHGLSASREQHLTEVMVIPSLCIHESKGRYKLSSTSLGLCKPHGFVPFALSEWRWPPGLANKGKGINPPCGSPLFSKLMQTIYRADRTCPGRICCTWLIVEVILGWQFSDALVVWNSCKFQSSGIRNSCLLSIFSIDLG